jgi:transposase
LSKLYADGGYQGPRFRATLQRIMQHLKIEMMKRSDDACGFRVLPKRWMVERTLALLNRCRHPAKDW